MEVVYLAVVASSKQPRSDDAEIYKRGTQDWAQNPEWRDKRTGKITLKSLRERLQLELEWVNSAIGSGQNNSGRGRGSSPPASSTPITPRRSSSGLNPNSSPTNSGTNRPYPGTDIV